MSDSGSYLGFLGILILCLTLLRRLAMRKKPAAPKPVRPQVNTESVSQSISRANDILVNLESISREINARIDVKIKILEELIRDADDRISQLQRLEGKSAKELPGQQKPSYLSSRERYDKIYALADKGLTTVEIAHETKMLKGEIELILSLRESERKIARQKEATGPS